MPRKQIMEFACLVIKRAYKNGLSANLLSKEKGPLNQLALIQWSVEKMALRTSLLS